MFLVDRNPKSGVWTHTDAMLVDLKYAPADSFGMTSEWYVTTESKEAEKTSPEHILEGLESVRSGESEFVVIEPEPESEESFFQASVWTKGIILGRSFIAEVRMPSGDGFRQVRLRTKDFDEIVEGAEAYLEGAFPSSDKWADVTDEFVDEIAPAS